MMDAHGLLLELEHELSILANADYTHIGIGFAYTKQKVMVVEFVSKKPLLVEQLAQTEDGGVEARGLTLDNTAGLYAARIAAISKMTKDIKVVGPAAIQFQKSTGKFSIHIPGPLEQVFYCNEDLKVIQFYIRRGQVDKIQYGANA